MTTSTPTHDFTTIKARQRQTWASGDFHAIASLIVPSPNACVDAVDLRAGQRVLDVAAGSGNAAIAAARRLCDVTGMDYVPALLDRGRARAAAEGLPVTFEEGDAEALPVADGSFDVVLSTFGSCSRPIRSALLGNCCGPRPGGHRSRQLVPGGLDRRGVARHRTSRSAARRTAPARPLGLRGWACASSSATARQRCS